jgi:hypothetical protein
LNRHVGAPRGNPRPSIDHPEFRIHARRLLVPPGAQLTATASDRVRVNSRLFTLKDGAGPQIVGAHFVGVIDCVQSRRIHREHYYSDGATAFSNINGGIEIRRIAIAFESLTCQHPDR